MRFAPAILTISLLWFFAIGWALIGYPIYRYQHLVAAIEYSTKGIDLLRPVIPGFNASGTGTPQDLLIWQAFASISMDAFGGRWGAPSPRSSFSPYSYQPSTKPHNWILV